MEDAMTSGDDVQARGLMYPLGAGEAVSIVSDFGK